MVEKFSAAEKLRFMACPTQNLNFHPIEIIGDNIRIINNTDDL